MLKKIAASNLFLIGGLGVLAIGAAQFYNTAIKPRFGK
jgi:hypothetical protein